MNYKIATLSNGLRVLTIPMPSLESATVTVWVKTGSRNEEDRVLGLSHFLEHMAFKGGRRYPSAKAVSEAIDASGGEFNASTSKEVTQYYVRIRSKLLQRAFDVLSDIVLQPTLKKNEIKKEKGVIIEEMNMYEDTPVRRIWDIFEQVIFSDHPLGRDIIGTRKTVSSLKRNDFSDYRNRFYFAENMLISVAGGVEEKEILSLSQKFFGEVQARNKTKEESNAPGNDRVRIKLVSKKVEQAHFIIGYPAEKLGGDNRYKDAFLNAILGSGMSSRLFTEVREKRGLAYSVRSDIERYLDTGYFAVYAGVDPSKAKEALKIILDQLYGLKSKKYKISKKEFEKTREYLKGHLALSLEDTRTVSSFFGGEELMLNKVRTPEEVYKKLDKIKIEDIYEAAEKIFDNKRANLAIIGPYKDEVQFEKLLM